MNKFVKSILALGVASAVGVTAVNAATYQVIDKGDVDTLKFTYSQKENNAGNMVLSGTNLYNFPVQFQYLDQDDFDDIETLARLRHEITFGLNDLEDKALLEAGTPTANDLAWAVLYLQGKVANVEFQQVGTFYTLLNFNEQIKQFDLFDIPFEGTDTLTRSTQNYVNGITNEDWVFGSGSAPYTTIDFVNDKDEELTYWVREFSARGYYSVDQGETIIPIMPIETTYGGETAILGMNSLRQAVGYSSVSIVELRQEIIDDTSGGCADESLLDDRPVEVCLQRLELGMYNNEAMKWTLSDQGVIESERLGYLITPHEDDKRDNVSVAQAINDNGVAVGYAYGWVDENETNPSSNETRAIYAVVFKDGQVRDFTEDHSEFFDSDAKDINNAGIAVGRVKTYINGTIRSKFYHVDTTDIDNMTMVRPKDFFTGASSVANAINNQGVIVGNGEVETHNDSANNPRRRHGFMYDINTQVFTDINDFLPCNSAYTIQDAIDISDSNEILASAVVKVPRKNSKGELVLDEQGNQLTEDVVRAVKLVPIEGEIEDCSKVEEKIERKGAGFGVVLLMSLFSFGLYRRFTR